ncbi:MAG: hypothetical protein A2045_13345 [Rhodocyclales bacterium GWA2_65_20]|nr:MAG: hypothetical protein A2045_13345 [Rhodocyclales bacterium GWA2_65_20]
MRAVAALLAGAACALLAAGCSALDAFGGSRQAAADWAAERGFAAADVKAGAFDLVAFVRRPPAAAATLTIYIEGDGAAWPTPYHPPRDPTPLRPVALALAAADPAPAVAYLARPCQYLDAAGLARCSSDYWTGRRFAAEVVDACDAAVGQLKKTYGARTIRLVGYSGGGVIAALLAARRDDVDALVTVAAPLALAEWAAWHGVSPLPGSLDPSAVDARLPPGVHFVGGDDKTVPAAIVERFVRTRGGRVEAVSGFDHECCWAREWAALLRRTLVQEKSK